MLQIYRAILSSSVSGIPGMPTAAKAWQFLRLPLSASLYNEPNTIASKPSFSPKRPFLF